MLIFRALIWGLLSLVVALATLSQLSAASLVNRYSFTANANDSVEAAHGTLAGGAPIVNGAVVLNGSGGYVDLPNGNPLITRLRNSTASAGVYVSLNPLTPGSTTNIILDATPGAANSVTTNLPAFPPLWLNEAQANNLTGPLDNFSQREPWAELFNTANTNVNLNGYYLTDTYTNLTKWAFPANNIASNGFTLIWCDNTTNQTTVAVIHAGLTLASGNGSLALTCIINGATQVVGYPNYSELPANWSCGSVLDAQPFYRRPMFYATPAATNNGASAPITAFINEWMADNTAILADPADRQFEAWFELYNPGTNTADVGGYWLTDNLSNKFQFQIPNNGQYLIRAGGYLLVWADNESSQNATNRADLHASFASAKGGEALGRFASNDTMIDSIIFGAQTSNVSEGRFSNGAINPYAMPTPRAANVVPNTPPTLAAITNRVVTLGQT